MLAVLVVDDLEDAVDVVNDTEYGLSAAVYTRDINAALWAVDHIDTGIVYVNAPTIGAEIPLPFGGNKHTGNGFREAGTRGIEQFSQVKTVYVDYSGRLQRAQIDNRPGLEEGFVMTLIGRHQRRASSEAWLARDEAALAATLGAGHRHRGGVEGQGSWLIDADGRRWLDLTSGIGVTNVGHCHPRVVEAASAQLGRLMHTSVVTHHQRNVELAERLARALPVVRRAAGLLLQHRRRGGRRRDQAGSPRDGTARHHRLPRRLPRAHAGRDVAHDGQGQVPRRLRAAARRR